MAAYQMDLTENDKQLIILVDTQVEQLLAKEAPAYAIVQALTSLVPDVKCLVNNAEKSELEPYLGRYLYFNYFVSLLEPHALK